MSRVSQRGRLRVKGERGRRENRDRPCAGRPFLFFCAARLDLLPRLPKSDSAGLLPAIDVNGPPKEGWVRDRRKKRITCQRPSADGSCVSFVRLRLVCARVEERGEGEGREKERSAGAESRSFVIRGALRDGGTRAIIPCFRTARHSARLGRERRRRRGGGVTSPSRYAARGGAPPEERRAPTRCDVRKGGVKIARGDSDRFARGARRGGKEEGDTEKKKKKERILTPAVDGRATAADRQLIARTRSVATARPGLPR